MPLRKNRFFRPAALGFVAGLLPCLAHAETPPETFTELSLDAEGHASAEPDQLTASLFAQSTAPGLAAAQGTLNALVARAGSAAGADSLTRQDYSTEQNGDKAKSWTARQSLSLKNAHAAGDGGKSMLDTVARLQGMGLGLDGLNWSISDDKREALLATARTRALQALQAQAKDAAHALGLRFVRFKSVRLNVSGGFRPPVMLMAARAAAMPSPESTPQTENVTIEASGTALLAP